MMKARHLGFMLLFLLVIAGFSAITMLLWNALLPGIFSIVTINFWQALGLLVLSRILFGGMGAGAMKRMHQCHHDSHHNLLHEKWAKMTPEQRMKFINKRRRFGFGGPFSREYFDMDEHEEAGKEND